MPVPPSNSSSSSIGLFLFDRRGEPQFLRHVRRVGEVVGLHLAGLHGRPALEVDRAGVRVVVGLLDQRQHVGVGNVGRVEVERHGVEGFEVELVQRRTETGLLPRVRVADEPERGALKHHVELVVDVEVELPFLGAVLPDVVA